jgi:hypothetical protein
MCAPIVTLIVSHADNPLLLCSCGVSIGVANRVSLADVSNEAEYSHYFKGIINYSEAISRSHVPSDKGLLFSVGR